MEGGQDGDGVDYSEVFALDKIAFNSRSLNYWCANTHPPVNSLPKLS